MSSFFKSILFSDFPYNKTLLYKTTEILQQKYANAFLGENLEANRYFH